MRRLFAKRSQSISTLAGPELKNPERELAYFRQRLLIAAVLILAGFAGLLSRFVYLQVFQHSHYETLAESNRIAIVPIVPNRGVITDRNGVILAQSYSAYTLEVTPSRVKNLDQTIDELGKLVEIQAGDRLVTSGIDGTYPAGLAVAQVASVERETGQIFARVTCKPLAGVERSPHVLILGRAAAALPQRPGEPTDADAPRSGRFNSGLSGESLSASQLAGSMPSTKRFGSKPGLDTNASTSPVAGSIATIAPRRSPNAASIACCRRMSSESRRLLPEVGGVRESVRTARPPASTSTSSTPVVPCSSRSYESSSPTLPM